MGVVCITMVCVFAGRGAIGEAIVLGTSWFHVGLAFWFYYMAIFKYSLLPDPSWFPNTVGLAYASIKTWLYYPMLGKVFMGLCMVCFFATFFVSVFRVAVNKKISAPVCWIQLSAPSITLYAITILAQPSVTREEQLESSVTLNDHFFDIHHKYYMPLQHFMMLLSLVGMASALLSLWQRWGTIRQKEFSPAHAAFCFPTLSHTNAVQAYRGAVNTFSTIAVGSSFKIALWSYWFTCLIVGTVVNFVFTYYYVSRLPNWTKVDIAGEDEPPAPDETILHEMQGAAGEQLIQSFVSPAVLQANEAGALVRVRRGTEDWNLHGPYVRSRHVTALGFDPTMTDVELRSERAALLDWVARNAPRTRNRTLSHGMIDFAPGLNQNMYGTFVPKSDARHEKGQHIRSQTLDFV